MKNWLAAAGRLCVDFILVLLVMAAIAALGTSPKEATAGDLVEVAVLAAFRLFPLAAAAAIFLGSYAFERRTGNRLLTWASALVLGFGLLVAGTALRRADVFPRPESGKPQAVAGAIVENGDRALYVQRYEGSFALNALGFDTGASRPPRIQYAPRAGRDFSTSAVAIGGSTYSGLPQAEAKRRILPELPGLEGRKLDDRLRSLDRMAMPTSLLVLGAFALLASGLAGFARIPRWPLVGFFFALAGFLLLFILDSAIASPAFIDILQRLASRLKLKGLSESHLVAAVECLLGLVLSLLLLLSRKEAEE
jgi:hypothetical protein